eukprot:gene3999-14082_t
MAITAITVVAPNISLANAPPARRITLPFVRTNVAIVAITVVDPCSILANAPTARRVALPTMAQHLVPHLHGLIPWKQGPLAMAPQQPEAPQAPFLTHTTSCAASHKLFGAEPRQEKAVHEHERAPAWIA